MLFSFEEEDDEHSKDNGKEGGPQQEDTDEDILCRLCHCWSDRRA